MNRNNLIDEIQNQMAIGFSYYEIRSNLISSGYAPADIAQAMEQINTTEETDYRESSPILSSVYLPFILAALTFALFFFIIPAATFAQFTVFFTLIGSACFAGLMAWGMFRFAFRNVKKYPWLDNSPVAIIITCVLSFFVLGGFLVSRGTNAEKDELIKNGILAKAVVLDGKKMRVKRSTTAWVNISFYTKNKGKCTAKLDISTGAFDRYFRGKEILILYSEKHPKMIAEINHQSHIEYYQLEEKLVEYQKYLNDE